MRKKKARRKTYVYNYHYEMKECFLYDILIYYIYVTIFFKVQWRLTMRMSSEGGGLKVDIWYYLSYLV